MDAQEKILSLISTQIETAGFEVVTGSDQSPTGALYIERAGEFGALARVQYEFQRERCLLSIFVSETSGHEYGVLSQPTGEGVVVRFTDRAAFSSFTAKLSATLAQLPKPEPKADEEHASHSRMR